ncbi:Hypothetical predicted protein [Olea europaea subsp. europaea]|uniref:Uncharacterized protein n=1 Tax=Olea europaea subsp. europaea TaxID=158383 RepID=A0A8S0TJ75_OLEEU|nr:Hypothetical predicted protein [Olea europaea subsp. europaea]
MTRREVDAKFTVERAALSTRWSGRSGGISGGNGWSVAMEVTRTSSPHKHPRRRVPALRAPMANGSVTHRQAAMAVAAAAAATHKPASKPLATGDDTINKLIHDIVAGADTYRRHVGAALELPSRSQAPRSFMFRLGGALRDALALRATSTPSRPEIVRACSPSRYPGGTAATIPDHGCARSNLGKGSHVDVAASRALESVVLLNGVIGRLLCVLLQVSLTVGGLLAVCQVSLEVGKSYHCPVLKGKENYGAWTYIMRTHLESMGVADKVHLTTSPVLMLEEAKELDLEKKARATSLHHAGREDRATSATREITLELESLRDRAIREVAQNQQVDEEKRYDALEKPD